MREVALGRLQRWMQEVVVHPGPIERALRSTGASRWMSPRRLGQVVRPSRTLTSAQRVGIYHGMYLSRLEEALETDYPALRGRLGAERFHALVRDYVRAHPSRSYTLNRLGDHLPGFLSRWSGVPQRRMLSDLARLEHAMSQVFDADEIPALRLEDVATRSPEQWASLRLEPIAALRLLALRYPVSERFERWLGSSKPRPRRASSIPAVRPKRKRVVVYRRDYRVFRRSLDGCAYRLLKRLEQGALLGDAVSASVRGRGTADTPQLFAWFREWVAEGFFRRPK